MKGVTSQLGNDSDSGKRFVTGTSDGGGDDTRRLESPAGLRRMKQPKKDFRDQLIIRLSAEKTEALDVYPWKLGWEIKAAKNHPMWRSGRCGNVVEFK